MLWLLGAFIHAMLCTRLDICYAVGLVSRYQSNPGLDHWTIVKHILQYLKRTRDMMLMHTSENFVVQGYTDCDFQEDRDMLKSTYRSVITLNGGAIVWRSIKKYSIADSTMEAKYIL